MKIPFLIFFVFLTLFASGQTLMDTCVCHISIKYPQKAIDNRISGTVIVEVNVNEDRTWSDPVVVQSVGYGCDEEALLSIKRMISKRNKCILRYKFSGETRRKYKFPFTFEPLED